MPSNENRVLQSAGSIVGARFVVRISAILAAWLVAYQLGPEGLGQLAIPNLAIGLAPFLTLGFSDGLLRALPLAASRSQQSLRQLRDTGFSGALLVAIAVASLLVVGVELVPGFLSADRALAILAIVCVFGSNLYKHVYSELSALHRYKRLAFLQFSQGQIRAVAVVLLVLLLPTPFKLYGVFAGLVISLATVELHYYWGRRHEAGAGFHMSAARQLLPNGFPISLWALAYTFLVVGDRIAVKLVLSPVEMGLYEQAVMGRELLLMFPAALMTVLIPEYSRKYGEAVPKSELLGEMLRQNLLLSVTCPFLLGILALCIPIAVPCILPQFVPGIPLYQFTAFSVVAMFLAFLPLSVLTSLGRPWLVFFSALGGIAIVLGFDTVYINRLDLMSAAQVTAAGWLVFSLALVASVAVQMGLTRRGCWRVLASFLAPVWAGVILLVIHRTLGNACKLSMLLLQLVTFSIAYLPVVYLYESRTGRLRVVLRGIGLLPRRLR